MAHIFTGYRPVRGLIPVAYLWPLTVLLGVFAFLNTHPIRPHDFWWHMAVGREILASRRIPAVDTFSFTVAGAPYPSYAAFWLPEVLLYLFYSLGGPALVVFAHSLTVTAAYGLTVALAWRVSGSPRVAAGATFLAAALGINDWNVRPQAATFFLAPLFLWAIYEIQRSERAGGGGAEREGGPTRTGQSLRFWGWLAVFPIGMALWVNGHGSFPLGLLIVGLWLVDEVWQIWRDGASVRLPHGAAAAAGALALAAAACLLNPRGLGAFSYLAEMSVHPVIQGMVPEWAPPTFSTITGTLFLIGLLLTAALLAVSPRRPAPLELLLFLAFAALGLRTVRGAIWFGLVMAPVWARHLSALFGTVLRSGPPYKRTFSATLLAVLLVVGALVTLPWFKEHLPLPPAKAGLISAETPVAATEFLLRERPPGPLFHAMPFGSYLIWAAQPAYPVFVDSRIELYAVDVWLDYLHISAAGCEWEERLARYGVCTLMLSPQEQPTLVAAARASPHWEQIYEDSAAVIFVRR